jgi:four helix bundle protein
MRISRGSCQELIDDLNICLDEGYGDAKELEDLKAEGYEVIHKINAYVFHLKKKIGSTGKSESDASDN